MEQYISKDALVAEIERLKKQLIKGACASQIAMETRCKEEAYNEVLSFLNTLEVKKVDLEKECKNYLENNFSSVEEPDEFLTTLMQLDDMVLFAKHFYELGLKSRIDKELIDELYSHINSIKDTADRMTSGNFMHNRAAIKFSANTIANVLEVMGLNANRDFRWHTEKDLIDFD